MRTHSSIQILQMTDTTLDLLHSFRAFLKAAEEGATIPPVDEHDLRHLHELCVERAKRYVGKDGVISVETTAWTCSPGANVPAVWLRHTQLRQLYRQGLLAQWQRGTELQDSVFRLAASFPMKGVQLDQEGFLRELRDGTES